MYKICISLPCCIAVSPKHCCLLPVWVNLVGYITYIGSVPFPTCCVRGFCMNWAVSVPSTFPRRAERSWADICSRGWKSPVMSPPRPVSKPVTYMVLGKHSPCWTSHLHVGLPALLCRNIKETVKRSFTTVSAILDGELRTGKDMQLYYSIWARSINYKSLWRQHLQNTGLLKLTMDCSLSKSKYIFPENLVCLSVSCSERSTYAHWLSLSVKTKSFPQSLRSEYELFHCLFSEIPPLSSHISLGQNREHCKSSETVVKRKEEFFLQSGYTQATNFNGRARLWIQYMIKRKTSCWWKLTQRQVLMSEYFSPI